MRRRLKMVMVPATTNNITTGIINTLLADGHSARRINIVGIYDIIRKVYRPSKMKKGFADIISCIFGYYVAIEIKKGDDVQSQEQIDYQKEVQDAGGIYFLAEGMQHFLTWYQLLKMTLMINKQDSLDLFGDVIEQNELLRDKFLEPPFSLLDGRGGIWQARKKKWIALGIKSEAGRDAECMPSSFGAELDENGLDKFGRKPMSGTSIFDPALCELMYRWFCPPGGHVLDPFAGGSVRGIVAGYLGFYYTGLELRAEQVASNILQAQDIKPGIIPMWVTGDSDISLNTIEPKSFDFILSCPPYHDLEVYSDDPNDLSNMDYDKFLIKYHSIIKKALAALKDNRFAVFVVGDLRDKDGFYKGFNSATKNCFIRNGAKLYNECKLMQPLGTAMLRANKIFGSNKKLIKVHEDVLVFYKGDPKQIQSTFNQPE